MFLPLLDFQAPLESDGTDAILVAASIYAEADDTFSASVNNTDLVFALGKSAAASEKFRFTADNEIGIAGICAECSIMSVKVLSDQGYGDWDVIADGIVWASDNGADVISLSLGGGQFQEYLEDAVNYTVANGSVVIAASGNINTEMDFYPASYEQCIAVGAAGSLPPSCC